MRSAGIAHVLSDDRMSGGTQRVTLGHIRHLTPGGHRQVVIFLSQPTGDPDLIGALDDEGVASVHLPYVGRPLRYLLSLARLLRARRIDRVLTHGLGFHLVVALAARIARAERTVVLVGNPIPADGAARRRTVLRTRLAAPLVHRIAACSAYVADDVVRGTGAAADRVTVLYNAFDVEEVVRRAEAVRSARVPGGRRRLLMVSRLDPIKDHVTVIRAVGLLRDNGLDVELAIAGSGPTEPALRREVAGLGLENAIRFLGDRTDVPEQLGAADIFVYGMTRDEGFGIAVAEAMAAGVPVVCSDAGPAREVLREGQDGLIVAPGDAESFAGAVLRLLGDPDLRTVLVAAARATCRARHDPDVIGRELDACLGLEPS